MSKNIHTVVFAVILCCVISVLLTAASTGLQRFQEKNVILDRQKNILKSVGLMAEDRMYAPEAIEKLYQRSIQAVWADPSGKIIERPTSGEQDVPVYLYTSDDTIEAYVIPINSRGLWGRIMGYLAIKRDGSTISGFTVYKHSETPGLGGEIEKNWFQKNFVGKKIVDQEGNFVSISIAKGKISDRIPKNQQIHYVDGISGATLTGKYLTAGVKQILESYEPVSIRFRKNLIKKLPGGG
ncbi:MAG TPA: FMN-binding protein [Deltaproteobacteria bacterium]|nr:FMN-binding protein [Deltaproteobacteria bacterium]